MRARTRLVLRGAGRPHRWRARHRRAAILAGLVGTAALALAAVLQVAWSWEARREASRRALRAQLAFAARMVGDEILRVGAHRRWTLLAPVLTRAADDLARDAVLDTLAARAAATLDGAGLGDDPYRGAFRLALDPRTGAPRPAHPLSARRGALADGPLAPALLAAVGARLAAGDAPETEPLAAFASVRGSQVANVVFVRTPATARTPALAVGVTYGRVRAVARSVEEARLLLPPLPGDGRPGAGAPGAPRPAGDPADAAVRLLGDGRQRPAAPGALGASAAGESVAVESAPIVAPWMRGAVGTRFLSGTGEVLYATAGWGPARWATPYRARVGYQSRPGGFALEMALDEACTEALVAAVVPPAERWLLGAVLALVVLLAGGGVAGLRRERELERLRARFVASVSHELRTPLATICAWSDTLLAGRQESEAQARRWLGIINREAHRVAAMADGVLVAAREEADRLRVTPRPCDAAEIVRDVLAAAQPVAAARGSALRALAPAACPARVDPDAFRQVLFNLVDNAIKYGPDGQTVTVSLHRALHRPALTVTVDDEGAGVAPADRRRVWRAYERLPAHEAVAGGSGLGLSVVRALVALHGGEVAVDDAPGGGARFRATFPDAAPPDASPADASPADASPADASPADASPPDSAAAKAADRPGALAGA